MATAQDVRRLALALPRAYEALVRDYVKFRVGRIVFLSISPDEELLGFGFPKEERAALVASEPGKFLMPVRSDERYNWVRARLARLDEAELAELVVDAWRMCVPKRVAEAYSASPGEHSTTPGTPRTPMALEPPDGLKSSRLRRVDFGPASPGERPPWNPPMA
jgi:hypothetical protein